MGAPRGENAGERLWNKFPKLCQKARGGEGSAEGGSVQELIPQAIPRGGAPKRATPPPPIRSAPKATPTRPFSPYVKHIGLKPLIVNKFRRGESDLRKGFFFGAGVRCFPACAAAENGRATPCGMTVLEVVPHRVAQPALSPAAEA